MLQRPEGPGWGPHMLEVCSCTPSQTNPLGDSEDDWKSIETKGRLVTLPIPVPLSWKRSRLRRFGLLPDEWLKGAKISF